MYLDCAEIAGNAAGAVQKAVSSRVRCSSYLAETVLVGCQMRSKLQTVLYSFCFIPATSRLKQLPSAIAK